MYSCTILIPVVKEFEFLKGCINQIKKFEHQEIQTKIIIANQSDDNIHNKILELYNNDSQIKIIKINQIDAGYPIDKGLEICDTEYFCSLDCDAFPISNKWLYIPIKLINKFNLSFVGKETELHNSYKQLGKFLHINNYFRISKTSIAKDISEKVGFIRPTNHTKAGYSPIVKDWINISCDNGVVSQVYSDLNDYGDKLSLRMNRIIGETPGMGVYGMIIEDLIFHLVFGFSEEWLSNQNQILGSNYLSIKNDINLNGLTDINIERLLTISRNIEDVTTP